MREKADANERQSCFSVFAFLAASHFLTAPSNSALTLAEIFGLSGCFATCCCCCACWIFSADGGLGAVSFLAAAALAAASS
jgi:hypothetical protein